MRMPRRVKIGHRLFEIIRWSKKAADAESARGEYRPEPPMIRIASYIKPFDQAEVMLHEVFHACWKDLPCDNVSEESAVTTLAENFAQVWSDNPDLIAWISDSLKRR